MVLRLFVQPGEGKHWIVPKRPEPLPANATISFAVISSTVLAAGYTSYATSYARRTGISNTISAPALFVRASARTGIWCAVAGAAVNWYYHEGFTSQVLASSGVKVSSDEGWKLYSKTDKYTIDDGLLAGTGLGLLSSAFLRRVPISWWAKCMGMTNIGACTGLLASHAYFHYTGERQKAISMLGQWRKRRTLEFHHVYWNKVLWNNLSPAAQAYVLANGIFHASLIPEEVYKTPEKFGFVNSDPTGVPPSVTEATATTPDTASSPQAPVEEKKSYYHQTDDYVKTLETMNVQEWKDYIESASQERRMFLRDAEHMSHLILQKMYDVTHNKYADDEERQQHLKQLQLMKVAYNKLREQAEEWDRRIHFGRLAIEHNALLKSPSSDSASAWTSTVMPSDADNHEPAFAMKEFEKMRETLEKEIKIFEWNSKHPSQTSEEKAAARRDAEDGRGLLRAADELFWELEKNIKEKEAKRKEIGLAKVEQVEVERPIEGKVAKVAEKETKGTQPDNGIGASKP